MFQFLSIIFFSWISSIFVGFFKSSRFFVSPCIFIYLLIPIQTYVRTAFTRTYPLNCLTIGIKFRIALITDYTSFLQTYCTHNITVWSPPSDISVKQQVTRSVIAPERPQVPVHFHPTPTFTSQPMTTTITPLKPTLSQDKKRKPAATFPKLSKTESTVLFSKNK